MISDHHQIITEIKKYLRLKIPNREGFSLKYVGTNKPSYHLNTHDTRLIAKNFVKTHQFDLHQYIKLVDSLYSGESYDEVSIAAKIIEFLPQLKAEFDINYLDK